MRIQPGSQFQWHRCHQNDSPSGCLHTLVLMHVFHQSNHALMYRPFSWTCGYCPTGVLLTTMRSNRAASSFTTRFHKVIRILQLSQLLQKVFPDLCSQIFPFYPFTHIPWTVQVWFPDALDMWKGHRCGCSPWSHCPVLLSVLTPLDGYIRGNKQLCALRDRCCWFWLNCCLQFFKDNLHGWSCKTTTSDSSISFDFSFLPFAVLSPSKVPK